MNQNQTAVTPSIQQALSSYGVFSTSIVEAHPQTFFDFQVYPAIGKLAFQFFQNTVGSNNYTQGNTNMPSNGSFPNPQNFLWTGIEVAFFSGVSPGSAAAAGKTQADDYNAVMTGPATCNMIINTKEYFRESPLAACPASFGVGGSIGIADTVAAISAIVTPYGEMKRTSGQLIASNTQFVGGITFDALIPTPSTVAGRIGMKIHGIWYQLAQ